MASPVFHRIQPIAEELGYGADFRVGVPEAEDLTGRPDLENLGPFRWQPAPAPKWLLPDSLGQLRSLQDYRDRPVIIIFYLGYGCLHCAEQLQALAPRTSDFAEAGIDIVAISTDGVVDLDRVAEPLHVSVAAAGANYVFNRSGQTIDVGGLLCLFDKDGPCANAVKDSQRTKTSDSTVRTLSIIWGTNDLPGRTAMTADWYQTLLENYHVTTETIS